MKEKCGYSIEHQADVVFHGDCMVCLTMSNQFWQLNCGHIICISCCRLYVKMNLECGWNLFKCMHANC
jgi:hypothetical protein